MLTLRPTGDYPALATFRSLDGENSRWQKFVFIFDGNITSLHISFVKLFVTEPGSRPVNKVNLCINKFTSTVLPVRHWYLYFAGGVC